MKLSLDKRRAEAIMSEAIKRKEGVRISLPTMAIALRMRDRFYKARKILETERYANLIFTVTDQDDKVYLTITNADVGLDAMGFTIEEISTGGTIGQTPFTITEEMEDFSDL